MPSDNLVVVFICNTNKMIYINEHTEELDIASALATVSPQRREQALKFRHENGQRLSLAVFLLLMEGLRKEYGILSPPVFDYTTDGKPYIANHPDIHFSFSHSGKVALCALSNQPVGADVEVPRKITPSLISYTMNDIEISQINGSSNPTMKFLYFWTRKEALLKLTGKGISNNMKQVLEDAGNYQLETLQTENYLYSIAKHKDLP